MESNRTVIHTGCPNLEQGPSIGTQHLVGQLPTNTLQLGGDGLRVLSSQVQHLNFIGRHLFQNLLLAVREHDGAQHIVALDQSLPGVA